MFSSIATAAQVATDSRHTDGRYYGRVTAEAIVAAEYLADHADTEVAEEIISLMIDDELYALEREWGEEATRWALTTEDSVVDHLAKLI